jgi:hypothetical protein
MNSQQDSQDVDSRIRDALRARTDQVSQRDLQPYPAPSGGPRRAPFSGLTRTWTVPVLAAAAVAAAVVATTVIADTARSQHHASPAAPSQQVPVPTSAPTPVASPSHSKPAPSSPAPSSVSPTPAPKQSVSPSATGSMSSAVTRTASAPPPATVFVLGYQPLWPFANLQQVDSWRAAYASNGSQPWHLDARQTALLFTRNNLGFTELDRTTTARISSTDAHIGVGYSNPNKRDVTAAVLHLVRFGNDAGSPWEVVGSDDTTFSLETPKYGSTVSSPMLIGGHLTGVDESIRVRILADGGTTAVNPIPAGGTNSPWSTGAVPFSQTGVLTIVASTGGHLQQVERFAIQGVHT